MNVSMLFISKPLRYTALLIINYSLLIALSSCSSTKQISKQANQYVINDSNLAKAHIGICVYDATDNKYLYNYQSDKYFIPASNTKIITCYAAMKHLGDSLVGLYYQEFSDTAMNVFATGDPTFLHADFANQPVLDFLKKQKRTIYLSSNGWNENAWGVGWSWDDYNDDYMAERSPFPVSGNTIKIKLDSSLALNSKVRKFSWNITPAYFTPAIDTQALFPPKLAVRRDMFDSVGRQKALIKFTIKRNLDDNRLNILFGNNIFKSTEIPFHTNVDSTAISILKKDYKLNIKSGSIDDNSLYLERPSYLAIRTIHSQPTDSLLKIMMHRSDNFYAEQSLLMVSNSMLGVMNDEKVVDTLLNSDYKDMPQLPQWVDGSGLSRFNLFTPQDFVFVLNKMRNNYSWNRITTTFETGGTGTLNNYYKNLKGKIFAKTGSLSNNIALSGYLITPKNKTLIFSVLVNNHTASATAVRRAVERFLIQVQAEN